MKHTTHTKGHYGIEDPELKFSKKGAQKDSNERNKSPKAQKVLKWHGNEEQTNIVVYYLLQSYGVYAVSYLNIEVIMKLILGPRQSYMDLNISVSTSRNWTSIND